MKMIFRLGAVMMICSIFYGCEGIQKAEGVILDKDTHQPVSKVIISTKDITANTVVGHIDSTNGLGQFTYERWFSVLVGKPPHLVLYFYSPGYKQLKHTFTGAGDQDTIYLEKLLPDQNINRPINK